MKRGTPDHPKTQALQSALGCPRYAAVGILESLWHFTALYAYQGDVGKFPDGQIEKWMGWDGEPGKLVAALVACQWLDAVDDGRRLVVHDWREHCEVSVQKRFMRDLEKAPRPDKSGQVGKCLDMSRHVCPAYSLEPRPSALSPSPKPVDNTNPPTPLPGGAPKPVRIPKTYPETANFTKWYALYPRRQGKADAIKAWHQVGAEDKVEALIEEIKCRVETDDDWHRDGGRYIPLPASWLRGRRWEDEPIDLTLAAPQPKQPSVKAGDF